MPAPIKVPERLHFFGDARLTADQFIGDFICWADGVKTLDLDDTRAARLAISCMRESACVWASGLPSEVQKSWPLFSVALLKRWSTFFPTADVEGPPAPADQPRDRCKDIEKGCILVVDGDDRNIGWISAALNETGEFLMTQERQNALLVSWNPSVPEQVVIKRSTQWLGMSWSALGTSLEKEESEKVTKGQITKLLRANVVVQGALSQFEKKDQATSTSVTWEHVCSQYCVWDLLRNGRITLRWNGTSDQRFSVTTFIRVRDGGAGAIYITNNYNGFVTKYSLTDQAEAEASAAKYSKIHLVFFPC